MGISTAPALFLGLGARILLDILTRNEDPSIRDHILVGCWQGVGLCYALKNDGVAIPAVMGVVAKIFVEYTIFQDAARAAVSTVTTVLGLMLTDFLSEVFDGPKDHQSDRKSSKPHSSAAPRTRRREDSGKSRRHPQQHQPVSDITSVDSNSELIGPRGTMTPLEREVAALRTRASLADSERRRFKEERKWAKAQGNAELAAQMKWQVKKYSALMKSFHREADEKLVQSSYTRIQSRLPPIQEEKSPGNLQPTRVTRPRVNSSTHPTVSVNIEPSQLKSAVRVHVR